MMFADPRIARLITLIRAALRPPAGAGRIALALGLGALCHATFAAGVLAMIVAMFFGLSESLGTVPWPKAALANAALIFQFPLAHSLLLTGKGGRVLARLIPGAHGQTLATTTYATLASRAGGFAAGICRDGRGLDGCQSRGHPAQSDMDGGAGPDP